LSKGFRARGVDLKGFRLLVGEPPGIIGGTMDVGISISIAVGVVTLVALVGSMFYWAGKVIERMDALAARMDTMSERMDTMSERMDTMSERMDAQGAQLGARIDAQAAQLGARIDAQGARLDARIDALAVVVAETRRELLAAIAYHEHDTDGTVRFRVPPAP